MTFARDLSDFALLDGGLEDSMERDLLIPFLFSVATEETPRQRWLEIEPTLEAGKPCILPNLLGMAAKKKKT